MIDFGTTTTKELREAAWRLLRRMWDAYAANLPPEAATTWERGGVSIRESSDESLISDAPDAQLEHSLAIMTQQRVYVPWEWIFFDSESGTEIGPRVEFQRMYELVMAGAFRVVAALTSERLFRNVEEELAVRRQFGVKGARIETMDKFQGDPRTPGAWQYTVTQATFAELHARKTSWQVGIKLEIMSRQGIPIGPLPDGYRVKTRAPSYHGKQGRPMEWEPVEPLASIIAEGRSRFMSGSSYADLARWSATTAIAGRTPPTDAAPEGHATNMYWWRDTLRNPKYAGYQMATQYMGFKPGKVSPRRPRLGRDSEVVACKLPPLWTLEDYRAIWAEGRRRTHAAKRRVTYRNYLLSGITVDADCGHPMSVRQKKPDGRFWMRCDRLGTEGPHRSHVRGDVAESELDALLGLLSFDDPLLLRQVDEELVSLIDGERESLERFAPNPQIAGVRQAIGALRDVGLPTSQLESELAELLVEEEHRRAAFYQPVLEFRRAKEALNDWARLWSAADTTSKNRMLRDVGVQVTIDVDADAKRGSPAHITEVTAKNPVFTLALAVALRSGVGDYREDSSSDPRIPALLVPVPERFQRVARVVGVTLDDVGNLRLHRPKTRFSDVVWALPRDEEWVSPKELADLAGEHRDRVRAAIRSGRLPATRVGTGSGQLYVRGTAATVYLASRQRHSDVESAA